MSNSYYIAGIVLLSLGVPLALIGMNRIRRLKPSTAMCIAIGVILTSMMGVTMLASRIHSSASLRQQQMSGNAQTVLALTLAIRTAALNGIPLPFDDYSRVLANNGNTSLRLGTFDAYHSLVAQGALVTPGAVRSAM